MKKTPEEMADHIREAIKNANEVIDEAYKEGYRVELALIGDSGVFIERITLKKEL